MTLSLGSIEGETEKQDKGLKEEGRRLTQLQSSLQQTTNLCQDLIRQLDQFDARVATIEPTIMPLYRNLSTISRVHNNIQSTLDIVRFLAEKNELAKREEYLLANGPSAENLDAYLGGIMRIEGAINEMRDSNLTFCEESTNGVALDLLLTKYKEWLNEATTLATTTETEFTDEEEGEDYSTVNVQIPAELTTRLLRIATFAATLDQQRQKGQSSQQMPLLTTVLGYYAEVRSLHLLDRLTPLFRISGGDSPMGPSGAGGYQRGSHPILRALDEFFRLARLEGNFASTILPTASYGPNCTIVGEGVRRALKHPADLVRMTSEALSTRVSKTVARGEFAECIWIFDVTEAFNELWNANQDSEVVKEMVAPALKGITAGAVEFLNQLVQQINNPPEREKAASANATVYDGTSTLLNCLKRMLEYKRVIEALLRRWAQTQRDTEMASGEGGTFILGTLPSNEDPTEVSFSLALYYQDLLKGLEVAIERLSRDYRRAIIGILFQLNNFHYIFRTIHSAPAFEAIITTESEQKYQLIEDSLLREYLNYWRTCASLMMAEGRGTSLPPKDRLKTFASELEDLVKNQEACAVPDVELRVRIISSVREIIIPSFTSFYNLNQPLFQAYGKVKLDPSTVEAMLNRLFQA